jgi:hypothetical protein
LRIASSVSTYLPPEERPYEGSPVSRSLLGHEPMNVAAAVADAAESRGIRPVQAQERETGRVQLPFLLEKVIVTADQARQSLSF